MAEAEEKIWTVGDCLEWTTGYLLERGQKHARVSAEWLLCAATGLERVDLYMYHDRPLSREERAAMHRGVRRRATGEPLQYIIGETSFRKLNIWCEPEVLIPRPETELLVELVLEHLAERVIGPKPPELPRTELPWNAAVEAARDAERAARRESAYAEEADTEEEHIGDHEEGEAQAAVAMHEADAPVEDGFEVDGWRRVARVLEVGCGTGCISLSLATERRGRIECVATDISGKAAALASRNRARCEVDEDTVDIRIGDLISPVLPDEYGTFDVLVSNPPYIPTAVLESIPREVRDYEPLLALDGGEDGLSIYRRLLGTAPTMLRPGGLFACELFEDAVEDAAALCRGAGMVNVRILEDLARRPRFVLAEMPAGDV